MTSSETLVPLRRIPPGPNSGWLFLQRIYSEKYFFCSSRMSMEASAIVPKTFCERRQLGLQKSHLMI